MSTLTVHFKEGGNIESKQSEMQALIKPNKLPQTQSKLIKKIKKI